MEKMRHIFPYDGFRTGQEEIIEFSKEIFENGKLGLLHAPTGIGKTAASLTGYFTTSKTETSSSNHLMALTRTKSQAKIYIEELEKISKENEKNEISFSVMRSKKDLCSMKEKKKELQELPYHKFLRACRLMRLNERCPFFSNSYNGNLPSPNLENARKWIHPKGTTTRLLKAGRKHRVCPYELAKRLIQKSNVTICSFNYVFSPNIRENLFSAPGLSFSETQFIIDEAHGLPGFISNTMSRSLSAYSLKKAKKEVDTVVREPREKKEVKRFLARFSYRIKELTENLGAVSHISSPKIIDKEAISHFLDLDMAERLSDIGEKLMKQETTLFPSSLSVADFLKECIKVEKKERYAFTVKCQKSESGNLYRLLSFNLVDPSPEAKKIFEEMNGALLLSGSLYPIDFYRSILGLTSTSLEKRTKSKILSSKFLREKRKIILDTTTTTKYEERGRKIYSKIAERISGVAKNIPTNKAILVVFPSYQVKREIEGLVNLKRPTFSEQRDTKLGGTLRYLEENPSTVIFSVARGKLTEGIDFRREEETLLGGVVLVGLPFPKFNEVAKYKKRYFDKKVGKRRSFFLTSISPAIRASVQAGGRLIRDKSDFGVIVILDKRFEKYKKHFPRTWRDVFYVRREEGLETEISSFFKDIKREKNGKELSS